MQRLNILAAALLIGAATAGAHAQTSLGFIDDQPIRNDLQGTLPGMVKFAQSHTVDPNGNAARELPMLATERDTLIMFLPATPIPTANHAQLRMDVYDGSTLLAEMALAPPETFPASDRTLRDARADVLYTKKAWTTRLPWKWMKPGVSLRFRYQNQVGTLAASNIEFSGASELVLQNIRIGMLAPAPAAANNWFETNTAQASIDYFQKIPVSRLTVGQYLPITLDRIVMPNGTIYTTASPSPDNGAPHNGDMREDIGKALISTGINLANYGVVTSTGRLAIPDHFRQVVMHQSVGRYANGVVQHGLSGGGGMATLYDLFGNEFSHELGHNFGLGHWPGGGRWSSHHATSGWGYDGFRRRMLSNLVWSEPAGDNVIEDYRTAPYKGLYRFNKDPMSSGEPDSALSRMTLHTGYTAKRVQEYLTGFHVVRSDSPTGYLRWDPTTRTMAQDSTIPKPVHAGVPVVTLLGYYDPRGVLPTTIYPALYGNYGHVHALPAGTADGCNLDVNYGAAAAPTSIALAPTLHDTSEMNKFHVNLRATPRPVDATISCIVDGVRKELHKLAIAAPSATLPAVYKVGREDGYLSSAMRLPTVPAIIGAKPVSTMAELESRMVDFYGPIANWSSAGRGAPGAMYRYDNPYSGRREYFMLRVFNYGYFPTNATTNAHWRYMGHADSHVNWAPEPFRAQRTTGASLNHRIAAYYGATAIKQAGAASPKIGDVYVQRNPTLAKLEYFQLKQSKVAAFPTNSRSNATWTYLGDQATMNTAFLKSTEHQFASYVARWNKQSVLMAWNDANPTGKVGDVYRYRQADGRFDYFALRTPSYWYFPSDKTSNQHWTYLGSYQ